MKDRLLRLLVHVRLLLAREHGQDLVEYALVVSLIAFGAISGMSKLSTELNTAFNTISSRIGSSL